MSIRARKKQINRRIGAALCSVALVRLTFGRNIDHQDMIVPVTVNDPISQFVGSIWYPLSDQYKCDGIIGWTAGDNLYDHPIDIDIGNCDPTHSDVSRKPIDDMVIALCNHLIDRKLCTKIELTAATHSSSLHWATSTSSRQLNNYVAKHSSIIKIEPSLVKIINGE